jgi:hypothetical protein
LGGCGGGRRSAAAAGRLDIWSVRLFVGSRVVHGSDGPEESEGKETAPDGDGCGRTDRDETETTGRADRLLRKRWAEYE